MAIRMARTFLKDVSKESADVEYFVENIPFGGKSLEFARPGSEIEAAGHLCVSMGSSVVDEWDGGAGRCGHRRGESHVRAPER